MHYISGPCQYYKCSYNIYLYQTYFGQLDRQSYTCLSHIQDLLICGTIEQFAMLYEYMDLCDIPPFVQCRPSVPVADRVESPRKLVPVEDRICCAKWGVCCFSRINYYKDIHVWRSFPCVMKFSQRRKSFTDGKRSRVLANFFKLAYGFDFTGELTLP